MSAPKGILALVERFDLHRDAYVSGKYNETQLRREFLDPFFEQLGWDVLNKQGWDERYKDVVHEDAIKIGGWTKAPDYAFRIGGVRKFFVEAKNPSKDIKTDPEPAYQLRRYAWSAKLPLSILSDFEEFAVYDCRVKPVKTDKASVGRTIYITYTEYADRWDEIAGIFSRDAVLKGSFDKYAESKRKKRGTAEVDEVFLQQIEVWRDVLARNLALRNPDLSVRELNVAVQRTIDRTIFLRICEDRGIEDYGLLQALLNGGRVYARLVELFHRADERYNSGLFHFKKEKGRAQPPDELTLGLSIDDKVLKEIIAGLYYPDSPYEFSVLPADILGQVYEQFLGKVIRLTAGHQAKVEEKPEVRKAGGVYYTPTYIVDYIVEHTVGKQLEDKTPKQAESLRIVDPACGSGSFLIGAYQKLLDWHRDWYVQDGAKKHAKAGKLYEGPGGEWRLTTAEKKRILTSSIYGVDIDSQAVEVTKLSLLLKVLEGESAETLQTSLKLFRERALPDLASNIKCGNSLIGSDFYKDRPMELFDEEERYRINVFDWEDEFPEVFGRKNPGFDVVIGNPPWGADLLDQELDYLRIGHRDVVARMTDSYIFFTSRALSLLRPTGTLGLLVPGTILNQTDATPLRARLLAHGMACVVNVGQRVFGPQVLNTSAIVVAQHVGSGSTIAVSDLSDVPREQRDGALRNVRGVDIERWDRIVRRDPHLTFFCSEPGPILLLGRLRERFALLEESLDGAIQRGITPDAVDAHVLSPETAEELEESLVRQSVSGTQVRRYRHWHPDQAVVYVTRDTQIARYPKTLKHLGNFRHLITCKEVKEGKHPWWCLHRPRDPKIFESPKLVGLTTTRRIELLFDRDQSLVVTDAMYVLRPMDRVDPWALLATLQSRTFLFLYRTANIGEGRVIPQVKASKLHTLPVPTLGRDGTRVVRLAQLASEMIDLDRQLQSTKTEDSVSRTKRQIAATDRQIDELVYELYGLTDKEIGIVEEATKR